MKTLKKATVILEYKDGTKEKKELPPDYHFNWFMQRGIKENPPEHGYRKYESNGNIVTCALIGKPKGMLDCLYEEIKPIIDRNVNMNS